MKTKKLKDLELKHDYFFYENGDGFLWIFSGDEVNPDFYLQVCCNKNLNFKSDFIKSGFSWGQCEDANQKTINEFFDGDWKNAFQFFQIKTQFLIFEKQGKEGNTMKIDFKDNETQKEIKDLMEDPLILCSPPFTTQELLTDVGDEVCEKAFDNFWHREKLKRHGFGPDDFSLPDFSDYLEELTDLLFEKALEMDIMKD